MQENVNLNIKYYVIHKVYNDEGGMKYLNQGWATCLGDTETIHLLKLGAMVEWLERLNYGAESRWKVMSLRLGLPSDDWKTLSVNPTVNGYLF